MTRPRPLAAPCTLNAAGPARRFGLPGRGAWAALCLLPALAGAAVSDERRALEAERAEAVLACQQRFAVTACVEAAEARYRAGRAELDAQRARDADARRRDRVARRALDRAAKAAPAADGPRTMLHAAPGAEAPRATPKPAPSTPPRRTTAPDAANAEAQAAAKRVQAAQEREREAARDRERIARRLAERAASGRAAQPLPVPADASR